MRVLVLLSLFLLAFALMPAPAAAVQPPGVGTPAANPLCVPPGALNGACVGNVNGDPCAWYWFGPSHSRACLTDYGPEVCSNHLFGPGWNCPLGTIRTPIVVCAPPGTLNYACVGEDVQNGGVCAWFYGGPAYSFACLRYDGRVESCSNSLYGPIYGPGWHCLGDPIP